MDDLIFASVGTLSRMISRREVSSVEVVHAHLALIDAVNPQLNAVVQVPAEAALLQAEAADKALAGGESLGPLHGVPMTIKDSFDTAGVISAGGTLGRASFVPEHDATVVARLRSAGAILIGKTNTPEFTSGAETDNLVYGRTNNPYNPELSPGGSSGGAAAIIAAGGSPFDIGTDTGGSIRMPAHFCGIAGLKPTAGRVSRAGHIIPYAMGVRDSLTQIGPLARWTADLSLIMSIISGVDWQDPTLVPMPFDDPSGVELRPLRVAFYTDDGINLVDAEVVAVVKEVASALSGTVQTVTEDRPAGLDQVAPMMDRLRGTDGGAWLQRMMRRTGTTQLSPLTQRLADRLPSAPETGAQTAELLIELDLVRSRMVGFLENYDAIVCPAAGFPAQPHGTCWYGGARVAGAYTAPHNLTGWPVAVVRAGTSAEGLPIGVQIAARPWRDDVALALAQFVEDAFGGWQRPPL